MYQHPKLKPHHRDGLVTDVPGPMCNRCSGTLISAWFLLDQSHHLHRLGTRSTRFLTYKI